MEEKTIRTCAECYWLSEVTYKTLLICIGDIPSHIPGIQQQKYRNQLTNKHRTLECDNFYNKMDAAKFSAWKNRGNE
jgi:hypothetical protein